MEPELSPEEFLKSKRNNMTEMQYNVASLYLFGITPVNISSMMNISLPSVNNLIRRIRAKYPELNIPSSYSRYDKEKHYASYQMYLEGKSIGEMKRELGKTKSVIMNSIISSCLHFKTPFSISKMREHGKKKKAEQLAYEAKLKEDKKKQELNSVLHLFTENQQSIILDWINGVSATESANKRNVTSQWIRYVRGRARTKIKERHGSIGATQQQSDCDTKDLVPQTTT